VQVPVVQVLLVLFLVHLLLMPEEEVVVLLRLIQAVQAVLGAEEQVLRMIW